MKRIGIILGLIIGVINAGYSQTMFGPQQVINVDTASTDLASSVYTVDLDGDGDLDVLSAFYNVGEIAYYKNDGNGNFVRQLIITTNGGCSGSVYAADLDGDGDLDALLDSGCDDKIAYYENDGNGNFASQTTISNDEPGSVYASDIDGDGDLDVLHSGPIGHIITYYENDGNGNFSNQIIISTIADGTISVYAADLDGDGDQEILSTSFENDKIAYYKNDGNGNFASQTIISINADGASSVYAADLDGDGDLDVLSASYNDNKIAYYENDGNGNFSSQTIISTNADGASSVYAADLDGDGDLDVLSASYVDDKIAYYENDGNGNFASQTIISTNVVAATSIYAADLNSDGNFDVLSSLDDDIIVWYENLLGEHKLTGNIFKDSILNCTFDSLEIPLSNFIVSAKQGNKTYYANSNSNGDYQLFTDTIGDFTLNIANAGNGWQNCIIDSTVTLTNESIQMVDFPMQSLYECTKLTVDISNDLLRRCFDNTYYISYCNNGTITATDAYIDIQLDPFLEFNSASIPHQIVDSIIRFEIGDVGIFECGSFLISTYLSCDAELGQNHCVEAIIYPNDFCGGEAGPTWDSSSVDVGAQCVGDSVEFRISNIGFGDMIEPLNYLVIEDNVIFREGTFQLNANEDFTFSEFVDDITYYIKADQATDHPGNSEPSAIAEGCNGIFTPSTANQFINDDQNTFTDIDCQQNIGSFDPNDKAADYIGYGPMHFIEANTPIEYKIRFQNTGTDTAFNIEIIDTISEHLDPATIVPGPSSHPYTFDLSGIGIATFTFEDIQLPDSNIDVEGSNGFVSFKINQKADNPDGTRIENNAGIYFDFNEPVITNTVFHTIGSDFIVKDIRVGLNPQVNQYNLNLYPNPTNGKILLDIKELNNLEQLSIKVYDQVGQEVYYKSNISSNQNLLEIDLSSFANGIYFIEVSDDAKAIYKNKVVVVR